MSYILTLIASDTPISDFHVQMLENFVQTQGLEQLTVPEWLDAQKAVDVGVATPPSMEQIFALRALFEQDRMDVLCVKKENRKKKLLLADMDSTIVTTETLDELADKAGIKDKIAAITTRAMKGELDFHAALAERVGLLKGLPLSALHETLDETILCDGAQSLVHTMRASGALCVLVSGGFTFFTQAIADKTGFDYHHGNTLHDDGRVLMGTVGAPILDKDAKLAFLKDYTQKRGLDLDDTVAIGDGANDLPMLAASGLGIGYRPKPVLEQNLINILKFADLKGVLYAQGYKDIC